MMTETSLTERQKRELEFYEEYSKRNPCQRVCFDPILGEESQPWNSYWHLYEVLKENFKSEDQKLLDFGCGWGEHSLVLVEADEPAAGADALGDQPGVSAGPGGAIDPGFPGLRVEQREHLGGQDRNVPRLGFMPGASLRMPAGLSPPAGSCAAAASDPS